MSDREHVGSQAGRIWSAVFYGISSILVIFTNKWLLTQFNFPHFKFVAAVQFVATSLILFILAMFKKVDIPFITPAIFREIMPISLMFLGNVLFGLGSTKALNIPMFTALRRFSILMTMLGEWWMLDSKPHSNVVISVSLMVGGAMLAACYDLAFDASGYTMVFLNNIFTAMNGIYLKKASLSGKCSKMGVMFYNSLFSALIMSAYFIGEHGYYLNAQLPGDISVHRAVTVQTSSLPFQLPHMLSNSELYLPASEGETPRKLWETWGEKGDNTPARALVDLPPPQLRGAIGGPSVGAMASASAAEELERAKLRLQALSAHMASESERFNAQMKQHMIHPIAKEPHQLLTIVTKKQEPVAVTAPVPAHTVSQPQSTIGLVMAYPGWGNWSFIAMLLGTCCMGSVLNYAIFLCTTRNSPLTTAVVGTMKNVFTTYIGMMVFSDYTFTWVNFLGINISIVGSLYYTYCTMKS